MYIQIDVRITRKFIALEIALKKLADPFNYAVFLKENKWEKETDAKEDLQDDAKVDAKHVEPGQCILSL